MEYLHKYCNEDDFQTDYGKLTVTAFTTPSSGTFVYDRYEEDYNGWGPAYVWKNGNVELITERRPPYVGDAGAYYPEGSEDVYVLGLIEGMVAKNYREPWVSVTERKFIEINGDEFEYVGEVDVHYQEEM